MKTDRLLVAMKTVRAVRSVCIHISLRNTREILKGRLTHDFMPLLSASTNQFISSYEQNDISIILVLILNK
jgi:hypothetical protein